MDNEQMHNNVGVSHLLLRSLQNWCELVWRTLLDPLDELVHHPTGLQSRK